MYLHIYLNNKQRQDRASSTPLCSEDSSLDSLAAVVPPTLMNGAMMSLHATQIKVHIILTTTRSTCHMPPPKFESQ